MIGSSRCARVVTIREVFDENQSHCRRGCSRRCGVGLVVAGTMGCVPYMAAAPMASVALVALLARKGAPLPMGKVLGGISYPFYLNHGVGLLLRKSMGRHLGLPVWGTFLAALAISFSFNWAHYRFVDRKVHAKRGGWYTTARGRACFAVGVVLAAVGVAAAWAFHRWPPC